MCKASTYFYFLPITALKAAFILFREKLWATSWFAYCSLHAAQVHVLLASVMTDDMKRPWYQIHFLKCVCNCQILSLLALAIYPSLFLPLSRTHTDTQLSWQGISCFPATLNWPHCEGKTTLQFSNVSGRFCVESSRKNKRIIGDPGGSDITWSHHLLFLSRDLSAPTLLRVYLPVWYLISLSMVQTPSLHRKAFIKVMDEVILPCYFPLCSLIPDLKRFFFTFQSSSSLVWICITSIINVHSRCCNNMIIDVYC